MSLPLLALSDVQIELSTRTLYRAEGPQTLTTAEARVLAHLVDGAGRKVSGEELLRAIWGRSWAGTPEELRPVRTTISRLRQKLERDPRAPQHSDFFAMLRGWAEERRGERGRLRLILTTSVDPSQLIARLHSSPFNIGREVLVRGLPPESVRGLADGEALWRAFEGHPWWTRWALWDAAAADEDAAARLARLAEPGGPLEPPLAALRLWLRSPPGGRAAPRCASGRRGCGTSRARQGRGASSSSTSWTRSSPCPSPSTTSSRPCAPSTTAGPWTRAGSGWRCA